MIKKVFIDGINENYARLLYGKEEFVVPCSLLPREAREGDTLSLNLEIDGDATQKAKEECEDLLNQLLCGKK